MGFFDSEKSSTTNSTSTYTPNSTAMNAYKDVLHQAGNLTQTPFNYNTTKQIAGFSPQQLQAFNQVGAMQGMWMPYMDAASQYTARGAGPVSGDQISGYMNPFQQQVIDSTMRNIDRQDAAQQSRLVGNAAASRALGGNRVGVAQANLAQTQGDARNAMMSNLAYQNYNQALSASQQDQNRSMQAGQQFAGFGSAAQQLGLQGAQALAASGNQQQAQLQSMYDAASGNYNAATMWPYQNLQFLGGLVAGTGPLMGGTTTGTSTTNQVNSPSGWDNVTSVFGALADGGRIRPRRGFGYADGGGVADEEFDYIDDWMAPRASDSAPAQKPVDMVDPEAGWKPQVEDIVREDNEEDIPEGDIKAAPVVVPQLITAQTDQSSQNKDSSKTDILGKIGKVAAFFMADGGAVEGFANGGFPQAGGMRPASPIIPQLISSGMDNSNPQNRPTEKKKKSDGILSKLDKMLGEYGGDETGGWQTETVPTESLPGYAEGGIVTPQVGNSTYAQTVAQPTVAGGFNAAPNAYYQDAQQRLTASQTAPVKAEPAPAPTRPRHLSIFDRLFGGLGTISGKGGKAGGQQEQQPQDWSTAHGYADGGEVDELDWLDPDFLVGAPDLGYEPAAHKADRLDLGDPSFIDSGLYVDMNRDMAEPDGNAPATGGFAPVAERALRPTQAAPVRETPRVPEEVAQPLGTLDFIKAQEGFAPVSKWDVRQWSSGWGTKAAGPGERIDEATAEKRLRAAVAPVEAWIDENIGVPLTPNQRASLVSFGHNLGVDDLEKLKDDINGGKIDRAATRMLSFNKALNEKTGQLEPLEGLTTRRQREAAMLAGSDLQPVEAPVRSASQYGTTQASARGGFSPAASRDIERPEADPTQDPNYRPSFAKQLFGGDLAFLNRYPNQDRGGILKRLTGLDLNPLGLTDAERRAMLANGISGMHGGSGTEGFSLLQRETENQRTNEMRAREMMMKMRPEFKEIGTDDFGRKKFGFVDPYRQTVTPVAGGGAGMSPAAGGAAADADLTGDDFMSTLPAAVADKTRNVIAGREPLPTPSRGDPTALQVQAAVRKVDPEYNANRWKYRQEWENPNKIVGRTRIANNTAIAHAGELSDLVESLPDVSAGPASKIANTAYNWWSEQTNDPALQQYRATAALLADEVTKVMIPTGGTLHDRQEQLAKLDPAKGRTAVNATLKEWTRLLDGKTKALADDWRKNMGKSADQPQVIDDVAEEQLVKLRSRYADKTKGEGDAEKKGADVQLEPGVGIDKGQLKSLPNGTIIKNKNGQRFRVEDGKAVAL